MPTIEVNSDIEAWFEYTPSFKLSVKEGNKRITDPEDPRWEGELRQAPFRGGCMGYMQIAEVLRAADGRVLDKTVKWGAHVHANKAREVMRQFHEAKGAGNEKPWDLERHYRNTIEDEKAQRANEGMAHAFQKVFEKHMQPVPDPEPVIDKTSNKTAGSYKAGGAA